MRIREKYEVMVEIPYKIVFILIFCYWEPCIFKIFAWVCFAFAARKLSWTRRSVMINILIHRVIIWIHSSVSFLFLAPISYFYFIEFRFFGKNFVAVQSLSHVWLFATPGTVANPKHSRLPFPPISPGVCSSSCPLNRWLLSNHLILCHPLLLLPSLFPSIREDPDVEKNKKL